MNTLNSSDFKVALHISPFAGCFDWKCQLYICLLISDFQSFSIWNNPVTLNESWQFILCPVFVLCRHFTAKMLLMLESRRAGLNTACAHKYICESFCSLALRASFPLWKSCFNDPASVFAFIWSPNAGLLGIAGDRWCGSLDLQLCVPLRWRLWQWYIHNELSAFRSLKNTDPSMLQLFWTLWKQCRFFLWRLDL